jgi:hypothetical protein
MNPSAITNGAGPAVGSEAPKPPQVTSLPASAPKPVHVMSVENTPLHGNTPAGGTPAPELRIEPEQPAAVRKAQDDDNVILGPHDPAAPKTSVQEPEVDIAGPDSAKTRRESDALAGETPPAKRRTDEDTGMTDATPGQPSAPTDLNTAVDGKEARPEKKAKITDKAAGLVSNVKSKIEQTLDDKKAGSKGDISRNNKDKPRAAAGRTERKTRSQGPADTL